MIKKWIIGILSTIVIGAVGVSAYNTATNTSVAEAMPIASNTSSVANQQSAINPATPNTGSSPARGQAESPGNGWSAQVASPSEKSVAANQANGNGNGYRHGAANNAGDGSGVPDPQNGLTGWVTLHGTVSNYAPPAFTLLADDGNAYPIELGNINYTSNLGLTMTEGDGVTVSAFWDANNALTVGQITLDRSGETYSLRDDLGRPLWAGGRNH